MAFLQELSLEEIRQAIETMADNGSVLALTVRSKGRWVTFRTHALASHELIIWVELPSASTQAPAYGFKAGEQIGMTFTLAHRKYVFAAKVVGQEAYRLEGETEGKALKLACPERMHRVERRLHRRIDVSGDEVSRATFWLGGWEVQPAENDPEAPVWSGRILNISGGGLLVRTSYEAAKYVEVGDVVGVQVSLGGTEQPALVDAQVRHCERDGEMALIGMQFVETVGGPEANAGIEAIRLRIAEHSRERQVAV